MFRRKGGVFLFVPFVFATRRFVLVIPFVVLLVVNTAAVDAAAALCGTSKTTKTTTKTVTTTTSSNDNSRTNRTTRTRIPILQYHNDWVVINKPSGITVHRGKSTPKHQRVITTTLKRQLGRKVFPVHRLDHRTSGALILAFNSQTAGELHNYAIRNGTKSYIALVRGEFHPNQIGQTIVINKPLTTINNNNNKKQNENDDVTTTTKDAITNFIPLATTKIGTSSFCGDDNENNDNNLYLYDRCSIVLCRPITGRTHQIRRHAYKMGHPIIGDTQHGDSKVNRYWRQYKSLNRLALHCWKINFDYNNSSSSSSSKLDLDFDDDAGNNIDTTTTTTTSDEGNNNNNNNNKRCNEQHHHECIAPLSAELIKVFETTHLSSVWKEALIKEPKLGLDLIDEKGGSHGRNYRKTGRTNKQTSQCEQKKKNKHEAVKIKTNYL